MKFDINITSEIGKLNAVILHKPGAELENMTPENAKKALYSDILNKEVANKEYNQFSSVLKKVTTTFEVHDLLKDIINRSDVKETLLDAILRNEYNFKEREKIDAMSNEQLAKQLITGIEMTKDTVTKFVSNEKYSLPPLHNFFFTRDASFAVGNQVIIGNMANIIRDREAIIMEHIFKYHDNFKAETVNPFNCSSCEKPLTIEGGDVLVPREDILIVGVGERTTTQGIDFLIKLYKDQNVKKHIIIQELPSEPESFIHLDMVFTLLDRNRCMVYKPLILGLNKFETIQIDIEYGKVKIERKSDIVYALNKLGMELEPIVCGGRNDVWQQEREQWHSGANFFTFEPGKALGYARNVHTMEALSDDGFEIVKAVDVISGKKHPDDFRKCIVTIDGAELSRGGGGARCMTMPINRDRV